MEEEDLERPPVLPSMKPKATLGNTSHGAKVQHGTSLPHSIINTDHPHIRIYSSLSTNGKFLNALVFCVF